MSARSLLVASVLGGTALLHSATVLGAAINVGNIELQPNQAGQVASITVTGGGQVGGINFIAVVNGGGPTMPEIDESFPAGLPGPTITSVAITGPGTLAPTNFNSPNVLQITPQLYTSSFLTTGSNTFLADGTLALITFDTTGFFGGVYTLALSYPPVDQATDFAGVPIDITNGTITVVPEPTTFGCIVAGTLVIARRRRAH